MKAYNVVTLVCVLVMVAAWIGTGYAAYTSTLTDDETITANNNYGTATLSETSSGTYTLTYEDTTANTVYLNMTVAGLSSYYAVGTIMDLWLGGSDASSEFGSTGYYATVSGTEMTALAKHIVPSDNVYTDKGTEFTVTCSGGTISVSAGGTALTMLNGNFFYGTDVYAVTASGDTVSDVSRIIPVNGSSGSYVFDDGGYRYIVTCSGSAVSAVSKCIVVSSAVDSYGIVTFNTWTTNLTGKSWTDTVELYCGGTDANIGNYYVDATFYSPGTEA